MQHLDHSASDRKMEAFVNFFSHARFRRAVGVCYHSRRKGRPTAARRHVMRERMAEKNRACQDQGDREGHRSAEQARRGGDGVISVAVNAFPRRFMACIDLAKRGDFDAAETAFAPKHEVVEALFAEGNPTGVKCALSILGLIGNRLRLPLVAGTPALEARLRELIRTYDLR